MTDDSGEAKPVDGAPASAPTAPSPPADATDAPLAEPAAFPVEPVAAPEAPPVENPTVSVEPPPVTEPSVGDPVPPAGEGDRREAVEGGATASVAEASPEPDPASASEAAPPAEEAAPPEPVSGIIAASAAVAEPIPVPTPPPLAVPRERRSMLPMLEFTAWRLLELVATVVAATVLIGFLLPAKGTADAAVLVVRLAVTVPLVILALLVAVIVGLLVGYAAARLGSWLDVTLRAVTTLGISLSSIWLAMLLVLLFALTLQWVQPGGFVPWQRSPLAALTSLLLPALALGLPLGSEIASRLRDRFAAVLNGPTMRTAEVMGLSRGEAIRDHAWRRALAGLFAQLGIPLAMLVPMSLVVEAVFYLPGLSRQIFTALADRDFAALQLGLVTLVALIALCRFLGRMLEAWFDPRIARRA